MVLGRDRKGRSVSCQGAGGRGTPSGGVTNLPTSAPLSAFLGIRGTPIATEAANECSPRRILSLEVLRPVQIRLDSFRARTMVYL